MPLLAIPTIILQIICGAHVIKTGQERYWLYLIIILPGLGCAIYAAAIILPGLLGSYKGRQVVKGVQNKLAPTRNLKSLQNQLTLSDNAETRTALADELASINRYGEAIPHYKAALTGIHAENPEILLKLAFAEFYVDDYLACQNTLDYLIKHNPQFRSQEGHLLYARALQESGNLVKAEEEYKVLVDYYPGSAARYHYAKCLQQQHRTMEAKAQLAEVQNYAQIAPKYYRNIHKAYLADIKKLIKELDEQ